MSPQDQFTVEDPEAKASDNSSSVEEKESEKIQPSTAIDVISVNSQDADEALELVGVKRTEFSEEYNERLRKKLVSKEI